MKTRGKIIGIWSCMFAGKTTAAQQHFANAIIGNRAAIMLIPAGDIRYTTNPLSISHDGKRFEATRVETLEGVNYEDYDKYFTIVIDEAQFIPGVESFCLEMKRRGKKVVVAGLRSDFKNNIWLHTINLMTMHCDEIVHLKGVCVVCGEDAMYTRKISGEGVTGVYVCTCLDHFTEPTTIDQSMIDLRKQSLDRIKLF